MQVLVVARIAQSRSVNGLVAVGQIDALFDAIGLPRPAKTSNQIRALSRCGFITSVKGGTGRAHWKLTPKGVQESIAVASDLDLMAMLAESSNEMPLLGGAIHPTIPPSLAPPELLLPVRDFCERHPFDTNVFAMTRFPDGGDDAPSDPLRDALATAREVCARHGLTLHLASDRKIVDDLWSNVAAHIWGCRYGMAFFESMSDEGLNYNLNIEVGSCLALGRRIAILKDSGVEALPTDLVGKIYHSVDLGNAKSVSANVHRWIRDDLDMGSCPDCPE